MNTTDADFPQHLALTLVGLIVATVVAGSVAFGVRQVQPRPAAAATTAADEAFTRVEQVAFGADGRLAPEAREVIERVAMRARERGQVSVVIVAYREAAGDVVANARAARERAEAVAHALEADGLPRAQLQMPESVPAPAGADASAVHRVDLRLD